MAMLLGAILLALLLSAAPVVAQELELGYILLCQSHGKGAPTGAINNMYPGDDYSWIVPSEMAVTGWALLELGEIDAAAAAGDYLVMVQQADGSWADQYHGSSPMRNSRTIRYTVQPVMFIAALHARLLRTYTTALSRSTAWLGARLHSSGLIRGGDDQDFWLSDNAYAVIVWHRLGQLDRRDAAVRAINQHFLNTDCWHHALSPEFLPREGAFGWVHFAPAMLDLRAFGVTYPDGLALRMRDALQVKQGLDAGAVLDQEGSSKRMPGIGFQASLAWRDLGANDLSASHRTWCESRSGLWQITPDVNGIRGGWVDWKMEGGGKAPIEQRFIDTSAYYLMVTHSLRFHFGLIEPTITSVALPVLRAPFSVPGARVAYPALAIPPAQFPWGLQSQMVSPAGTPVPPMGLFEQSLLDLLPPARTPNSISMARNNSLHMKITLVFLCTLSLGSVVAVVALTHSRCSHSHQNYQTVGIMPASKAP